MISIAPASSPKTPEAKPALVTLAPSPARANASTADRLRLSDVSGGAGHRAERLSALRDGARAGDACYRNARGIHLPHASGDCPARAGKLPDLWHGPGAAHGHGAGRRKSRTAGDDSPVLDQRRADRPAARRRDGRHAAGDDRSASVTGRLVALDRTGAGDAGRAVGRLAVLSARVDIRREPFHQHVHPDRDGNGRGVFV